LIRTARAFIVVAAMLAGAGCARQPQQYVMIDPATGQQLGVVNAQPQYAQPAYAQPQYAQAAVPQQPQYAQQPYGQPQYTHPSAAQPQYVQQQYAQQYVTPAPQPAAPRQAQADRPRGLFTSGTFSQPRTYAATPGTGGPYVAAPNAYASAPATAVEPYTLDAGDKLRVMVFGQEGITNTYLVDAGGNVTLPLIGTVPARGMTTQQLAQDITERLKHGYVREPHVSVEVEVARPFFILGEVTTPGQYPYVANMTVETAIAIAGGFGPRASKSKVQLTRNMPGQQVRGDVPLNYPLRPGDTIVVKERWF